jgi:hypothetical protein
MLPSATCASYTLSGRVAGPLTTIRGGLDEAGGEAFGDLGIEPNGTDTVLIGELDQPGMRSLQVRLQTLGLQIVDLRTDPPTF